jgi:hypothetical protein
LLLLEVTDTEAVTDGVGLRLAVTEVDDVRDTDAVDDVVLLLLAVTDIDALTDVVGVRDGEVDGPGEADGVFVGDIEGVPVRLPVAVVEAVLEIDFVADMEAV